MNEKDAAPLENVALQNSSATEAEATVSKKEILELFNAIEKLNNNIDNLNKMMARANSASRQKTDKLPRPPKVIH